MVIESDTFVCYHYIDIGMNDVIMYMYEAIFRKGEVKMIYFNVCAIIVLIILAFATFFRKMASDIPGKLFVAMLALSIITALCDTWSISMDNYAVSHPDLVTAGGENTRYAAHYCYLLMRSLITPVYIVYLVSLTDTWHKLKNGVLLKCFLTVPYAIVLCLMIVNLFNGCMFCFDSVTRAYTRGVCFTALYVCAAVYVVYGFVYMMKYKNLFTFDKQVSLYAIFPLNLAAVLIQWFNPGMQVEMFASSIALLLITITVQRPEETIDSCTGLKKYSAYAADMKRNFSNEKHVEIVVINIANFSSVTGIVGYDGTNDLLRTIAVCLSSLNREIKTNADIYYLDNGRFRFVLCGKSTEMTHEAADRINSQFRRGFIFNQLELNLIAYVCIVRCPEDIGDFKSLMAFGNDFHEKFSYSGNVVTAAELVLKNRFSLTNELDAIIDNAIANKKFKVYYQPIYSVQNKKFVSAEALLRLIDDEYGFISPDLFITAAEKSGAIHRIGDYVLEEVCRFIASDEFERLGLEYIEINLSVAQCMQADLADKVLEVINRYGVSPSKINLEITETAANHAQNIMTSNIDRLIDAGISFSLDDYGTGYSNIKSVASLPLSIVKLDKSFVNEEDNPRMWIVLQNTVKMLKDMDMHIVVEGVETEQIVDKFSALDCEYIQGYYYSKPIPEQEFIEFMTAAVCAG